MIPLAWPALAAILPRWRLIAAAAGVVAVAALLAYGASQARGALSDARRAGYAEAEAVWKAAIAKANADAEKRIAEAWKQAAEVSARLAAENAALETKLQEAIHAAQKLPAGDRVCLDRQRVRLLPP